MSNINELTESINLIEFHINKLKNRFQLSTKIDNWELVKNKWQKFFKVIQEIDYQLENNILSFHFLLLSILNVKNDLDEITKVIENEISKEEGI